MTERLSPEAAALIMALRDARPNAAIDDAFKRRLQSRLAASLLGLTPAVGDALPGSHAQSSKLASVAHPTTAVSDATARSGMLASKLAGLTKATVLVWFVPTFALGVLTGVGADRWQMRQAKPRLPPVVATPSEAAPNRQQRFEPTERDVVSPESLEVIAPVRPPAAGVAGLTENVNSLAVERRLLDAARQALARGEPQAGLAPLELHAKRFANGKLSEEREALGVRLLAALGNRAAALERTERFHRRFPNSLFAPAVDNAVAPFVRRNHEGESKQ
jgi:hypothetical protein